MNFKHALFIGCFLLPSLIHAQNFVFSRAEINEFQLADFIVKVKQLNVGSDSPDVLTKTLGNPALKTRQSGLEEWEYDFLLIEAKILKTCKKSIMPWMKEGRGDSGCL